MKFNNKPFILGSWLCADSTAIAELMAMCGFDFLTIDAEHSPVGISECYSLLQAIKSGNPECLALVRMPGNNYDETKRFMDAGADGVICPMIKTKEDVENVVQAVKYAPTGSRGVGYCRANNYGMNLQKSVSEDNDKTIIVLQIEHIDAINNLDDILSVNGIDAAIIGPYDLSASMGITGDFSHPDMIAAIKKNLDACIKYGVMPGIHVVKPSIDEVQSRIDQGYKFIAYSVDITMISTLSQDFLQHFKSKK
jgi:2-dehydro-3-deoxyglucarate aldolase